jgi:predicted nucleic acid-binding protein
VIDWMDTHSDALFLSAITIAELEDGVAKLRREGARHKAADLAAWLETLFHLYDDRILAFDTATARIAGALSARVRAHGHAPGFPDIAIAATAQRHGLTLLSRNVRHFAPMGIRASASS